MRNFLLRSCSTKLQTFLHNFKNWFQSQYCYISFDNAEENLPVGGRFTKIQNCKHSCKTSKTSSILNVIMFKLIMQKKNFLVRCRSTKIHNYKHSCKISKTSFCLKLIMFELITQEKSPRERSLYETTNLQFFWKSSKTSLSLSIFMFEMIMQKKSPCVRWLYRITKL